MKKYIYTGFLALVLILTSSHSFAKFTITPGIDVRVEYNDNIFLEESNTDEDFITTFRPNIVLEYAPSSTFDLMFEYGFNYRNYSDHSAENEEAHMLELNATARPFKRVLIEVSDIYSRVPIDIRDTFAPDNTITNMTDSNSFLISTSVTIPLTATVSTKVGYSYNDLWYENEGSIDSETHSASVALSYMITPKITGELKYNFSAYRPDMTGTPGTVVKYDRNDGSVAIEYRVASNLTVDGELGESWLDYDTRDNTRVSFWNAGAEYTLKSVSDMSVGIKYSRYLNDSSTVGTSKNHRGDLFFRAGNILKDDRLIGHQIIVNPYFDEATFINIDRKDKLKGIKVDISQPVTTKVTLLLNGLWEDQEFLPENEKVQRYSLGCGFEYAFSPKIAADIGYRYNGRDSDVDIEDFNNNIVWLQAKVSF
ncbi:MAG: TIGR03016 family PEP-CTERM system-associated outer membrane protein [Nitrospira sp.]|nr:TIGR03016 family PEP-CTERM system-associated outer membrane protein [Nitrospira sp.]